MSPGNSKASSAQNVTVGSDSGVSESRAASAMALVNLGSRTTDTGTSQTRNDEPPPQQQEKRPDLPSLVAIMKGLRPSARMPFINALKDAGVSEEHIYEELRKA